MSALIQRSLFLLALCACATVAHADNTANGKPEPAMCKQVDYGGALPADGPLNGPVVLTANRVELEKDGFSTLLGSVLLKQGGKEFSSQALNYDDTHRLVKVRQESLFRTQLLTIRSQQADFDLNSQSGAFSGTQFYLPTRAARGTADRITLYRSGAADIEHVSYTTCSPGSDAWYVKASDIHLNYDEGIGTAKNARLVLDNVPVFYSPYFRFPLDSNRHSGLLFPTIGDTSGNGLDVRIPLYLNLAPNYDATLTPRYMSKRGTQIDTAFRYLLPQSEGKFDYAYLDHDRSTGTDRSLLAFDQQGLINSRLSTNVNFTSVSDPNYFSDLGTAIEANTISYLDRSASLTYQAPTAYSITGLVQNYETLDTTIPLDSQPYRRLPQIHIDALSPGSLYNTRLGFTGEYDYFVRPDSIDGQRIDMQPYLRFERDNIDWYGSSQVDFRYTGYAISNPSAGYSHEPSRALPSLSGDGGLRFDRVTAGGNLQTLEPEIGYLYAPYRNQDALPVFDSGEPQFDSTQLFARNRFYGADRVSDANHAVAALTSRLLNPDTGYVWLTGSIGQIYRFEAPRVNLPGLAAPAQGPTDFIADLEYRLSAHWVTTTDLQWSPVNGKFSRNELGLHYNGDGRRLDLAYHYSQGVLEQTDMIVSTPIYGAWRTAAHWRYSIADHQTLESLFGVEYDTCCWALRTSYRRYIANVNGQSDNGVYFQLELKGLSRIGTGYEGLLPIDQTLPPPK